MFSSQSPVRTKIQQQKVKLSSTGVLELTHMSIPSIDIGVQRALFTLDVSDTDLRSFAKLQPQPHLKWIRACNCPLSTFEGLDQQPKLSQITMTNTPLSDQEYFRLAALIAIGPRLNTVNDQNLTKTERRRASLYPPIAKTLLLKGWILQYPVPSTEDFEHICTLFDVEYTSKDLEVPNGECPPMSPKKSQNDASTIAGNEDETPSFAEEVANILSPLGFPIRLGENMKDDILNSVDQMIQLLSRMETTKLDEPASPQQ